MFQFLDICLHVFFCTSVVSSKHLVLNSALFVRHRWERPRYFSVAQEKLTVSHSVTRFFH